MHPKNVFLAVILSVVIAESTCRWLDAFEVRAHSIRAAEQVWSALRSAIRPNPEATGRPESTFVGGN
jgi:hypothetical protein